MKTSCTKRFAGENNVQMWDVIKTNTASVG